MLFVLLLSIQKEKVKISHKMRFYAKEHKEVRKYAILICLTERKVISRISTIK